MFARHFFLVLKLDVLVTGSHRILTLRMQGSVLYTDPQMHKISVSFDKELRLLGLCL